jgi:hypothetical protein
MNTKVLPIVIIVIDIGAAIVYGMHKDVRHTAYWLAAAVLTASVTF